MHDISKKMKEKATADSGRNFPPPLNDLNSYIGPQNLKKKKKNTKTKTNSRNSKNKQLKRNILEQIEKSKDDKMKREMEE